jgi:hypothetical protein
MLVAEFLIGLGLLCVMVFVAKIAYWFGKKSVKVKENENV